MNFEPIRQIKVGLSFVDSVLPVGQLARRKNKLYFAYDAAFIEQGIEISPLKCPLKPGVQTFDPFLFEGLPGVFNDSLPDGWGRLLLDRQMRAQGVLPQQLSALDRLAYVGCNGMGALVYQPDYADDKRPVVLNLACIDLDRLAEQAGEVLAGGAADVLQELLLLGGSSAGARPKAMIGVDHNKSTIVHGVYPLKKGYESWLVKFPNRYDGFDVGAIEYVYALMAKEAGLAMTDVHLFAAQKSPGYFATQRFDRHHRERLHSHSACGLLHSDFRVPSLDYETLIALTMILTKDRRDVEKMYRLAVFNVLAHNRDDHAKNISFLMDKTGEWRLSPAYDLTFSSGLGGEQSTTVMGEGKNPTASDLVKLGIEAKLPRVIIDSAIEQTKAALGKWRLLAKRYDVSQENIDWIASKIAISASR